MREQITQIIIIVAPYLLNLIMLLTGLIKMFIGLKQLKAQVVDMKEMREVKEQLNTLAKENAELKRQLNKTLTLITRVEHTE